MAFDVPDYDLACLNGLHLEFDVWVLPRDVTKESCNLNSVLLIEFRKGVVGETQ
ncbi:MAG: hypothetical protein WDM77_15780 [Steroidobacteraceae bacterium]